MAHVGFRVLGFGFKVLKMEETLGGVGPVSPKEESCHHALWGQERLAKDL